MLTTWTTLVIPILDYCSQLWSPHKQGDIQLIEDVQRCFTRKIPIHGRKCYWERLRSLRLYSLERRRERYKIIYVWKMLENLVPNLSTEHNRIKSKMSSRHGRLCVIPSVSKTASARVQTLLLMCERPQAIQYFASEYSKYNKCRGQHLQEEAR